MTNTDYAPPRTTPTRPLRRSRNDRMVSGVAGGLGSYFRLDPVIFRVLFAVLSFFGGVGLLMYALAWLLIPEPDVSTSALDRAIEQLRVHRVPPALVILGGALVLWLAWFSWWAPGPTFSAVLLFAVLALVVVNRISKAAPDRSARDGQVNPPSGTDVPPEPGASGWPFGTAEPAGTAVLPVPPRDESEQWTAPERTAPQHWTVTEPAPSVTDAAPVTAAEPLIAPLSDTRHGMQAWLAEASEAHRNRVRRRRPIKVGVALTLALAWGFIGLLDAFNRVPFPAYIWSGLAVVTTGLVLSLVIRRMTMSLLVPIVVLALAALAFGGTRASLRDGFGQIGWRPESATQLTDHRQFAGQSTLDLTRLPQATTATSVRITQAAGEVIVRLPSTLNAAVVAKVHQGNIRNGDARVVPDNVSGVNINLEIDPPAGLTGARITVYVDLTVGQVQVDRT